MKGVPWFAISGRVGRRAYWLMGMLPQAAVGFVIGLLLPLAERWAALGDDDASTLLLLAMAAAWLPTMVMGTGIAVRRMHDLGRGGAWVVLNFVPLAGLAMLVWQGFYRGMAGPNAYGPDPLADAGWLLVGRSGQYAQCVFPLQAPIVFGTDPRQASVVIDEQRHPHIEPAHCQLRPPAPGRPAELYWPQAGHGFERRDAGFDGRELDLGGGLRFSVKAAA